ncbi:hypothetical protein BDV06DRAFT_228313 [Aspergillus oleicola]
MQSLPAEPGDTVSKPTAGKQRVAETANQQNLDNDPSSSPATNRAAPATTPQAQRTQSIHPLQPKPPPTDTTTEQKTESEIVRFNEQAAPLEGGPPLTPYDPNFGRPPAFPRPGTEPTKPRRKPPRRDPSRSVSTANRQQPPSSQTTPAHQPNPPAPECPDTDDIDNELDPGGLDMFGSMIDQCLHVRVADVSGVSDHLPIKATLNLHLTLEQPSPRRNWKAADVAKLHDSLSLPFLPSLETPADIDTVISTKYCQKHRIEAPEWMITDYRRKLRTSKKLTRLLRAEPTGRKCLKPARSPLHAAPLEWGRNSLQASRQSCSPYEVLLPTSPERRPHRHRWLCLPPAARSPGDLSTGGKALGPDTIANRALQASADQLAPRMAAIYDSCIQLSYCPQQFRDSCTIALRKPGKDDYTKPKSYPPIAPLNTLGNVLGGDPCLPPQLPCRTLPFIWYWRLPPQPERRASSSAPCSSTSPAPLTMYPTPASPTTYANDEYRRGWSAG